MKGGTWLEEQNTNGGVTVGIAGVTDDAWEAFPGNVKVGR